MHFDVGLGLGQLEARVLERRDRCAERLARRHVFDGFFERALRMRDRRDRELEPFARQLVDQMAEAAPEATELRPEERRVGTARVRTCSTRWAPHNSNKKQQ